MNNHNAYRADIDGLRAVAVLSVFAYHLLPERIVGGFVGVDVFFVISGYLISSIIYGDLEAGTFSIIGFYVRRIRRIYPALFLVLTAVSLSGWFLLLPAEFVSVGKQIAGGSAFIGNFVLWWQSGYFSPDASLKPLLHLWSLGVEEQYYLFFPLICIASYRGRSRWVLPAVLAVIAFLSMVFNISEVRSDSSGAFFLPFSRLWELLLGAGLSLLLRRYDGKFFQFGYGEIWRSIIGAVGLALIMGSVFGISQFNLFPGWWALLPTSGAAMVIAVGPTAWVNRRLLSSRPAVFVGLISYPLYLWHWPILSFMRIAKRSWGLVIPFYLKGALIVCASLCLAYLTYRFVEIPIRNSMRGERGKNIAFWLLGSVATTGAFGMFVVSTNGFPLRFPAAIVALDHDFAADDSNAWRAGTCFLRSDQAANAFTGDCIDQEMNKKGSPLVLFWGDSHAADLLPGFHALLGHSQNVRFAQYTASLCAPILGVDFRASPGCRKVNDWVIGRVRILKPDIVVLSAFWDYQDADHAPAKFAEEFPNTIQAITEAGAKRVIVIGSVPNWSNDVPILLLNEVRHTPSAGVPNRLSRQLLLAHDDTYLASAVRKAGGTYISVFDKLCDQFSCLESTGPTWRDIITYDSAHFTVHGSTIVAGFIWPQIAASTSAIDSKLQPFGTKIADTYSHSGTGSTVPGNSP